MWDIAREVTDDVIGPGAYADANEGNPDPRVQQQVRISRERQRRLESKTTDSDGRVTS